MKELTLDQCDWAIKNAKWSTHYERLHDITVTETNIVFDSPDLRIYEQLKSDGQKGLKIVFKLGVDSDKYFIWSILEKQAEDLLSLFPKLYIDACRHNKEFWKNSK